MGWKGYHLHLFTMPHPRTKQERSFGIHNLSQDCDDPPGWAHQIASMFTYSNDTALYEYDFGDNWRHTVRLTEVLRREFQLRYPRCIGGARACPPEDCGGTYLFAEILANFTAGTLDDEMRTWLPPDYDPARFDPNAIYFSEPSRRLAYSWYGDFDAGDLPYDEHDPRNAGLQ